MDDKEPKPKESQWGLALLVLIIGAMFMLPMIMSVVRDIRNL